MPSLESEERSENRSTVVKCRINAGLVLFLMMLTGAALYSNALDGPFMLDSDLRIVQNPQVRMTRLEADALMGAAFGKYSTTNRPLSNLTFAVNYYLHGYRPLGYRLVNIALHVLTGFFLFLFFRETLSLPVVGLARTEADAISFGAALLWLVHPVNTQSVSYVVQRMNVMAALFYIVAFWCYLRGRRKRDIRHRVGWWTTGAASWLLALGSKENAAVLPFFILLYEWFFFQDLRRDWIRKNGITVLILIGLFAMASMFYLGADPPAKLSSLLNYSNRDFTLEERVFTQLRVVVHYIGLLFFPHPSRLNLDYDFPLSRSLFDPITTLFAGLLILGLLAAAVFLARRHRLLSFSIFWFFGSQVLESSIFPLEIIFEHRTYLPFMAGCLVIVLAVFYWVRQRRLAVFLLASLAAVFSIWTYQRNAIWADEILFYSDCLKKAPNKARTHYNLGVVLAEDGQLDAAIEHFSQALGIDSDHAQARDALGAALAKKGVVPEQIESFAENPLALVNLGNENYRKGEWEKAKAHYLRALKIRPGDAGVLNNLGLVLIELGDWQEADRIFNGLLKEGPDDPNLYYNLGLLEARQGKDKEAVAAFDRAVKLRPDYPAVYNQMGLIFIRRGNRTGACRFFNLALQVQENFAPARENKKSFCSEP